MYVNGLYAICWQVIGQRLSQIATDISGIITRSPYSWIVHVHTHVTTRRPSRCTTQTQRKNTTESHSGNYELSVVSL